MTAEPAPASAERDSVDHAALRLMLSYVEAECLRIGATDAARHAALAAALVPAADPAPQMPLMPVVLQGPSPASHPARPGRTPRSRGLRLH